MSTLEFLYIQNQQSTVMRLSQYSKKQIFIFDNVGNLSKEEPFGLTSSK